jgi:hypothetical protein
VDEPLSPVARSLGEKTGELLGIAPCCLWLDRFSGRRVIRIGSKETHHYLSAARLTLLDPLPHFAVQFYRLSAYYDVMTDFRAYRVLTRLLVVVRDAAALFAGERRTLGMLLPIIFRKFQPIRAPRETIQPYETLPKQPLVFGMFALDALAFGHRVPPHDECATASIVPRFAAFGKVFPSRGLPTLFKHHMTSAIR